MAEAPILTDDETVELAVRDDGVIRIALPHLWLEGGTINALRTVKIMGHAFFKAYDVWGRFEGEYVVGFQHLELSGQTVRITMSPAVPASTNQRGNHT